MGMGTSGVSIVAITHEDMQKLLPKEIKKLDEILNECDDSSFDLFADVFSRYDTDGEGLYTDEQAEQINKEIKKIQKAFNKKYPTLQVSLFYHSEDDGDRYDDFFGGVWEISNAWRKTEDALQVEIDLKKKNALDFQSITFFG